MITTINTDALTATQGANDAAAMFFMGSGSGFDAANKSSKRGYVQWSAVDSWDDLEEWDRLELYKGSRWLTENVGSAKNLVLGISTMIGSLRRLSITGDADLDERIDDYLMERFGEALSFDVAGKFDFYGGQEMLNRHRLVEGDHCTILTESEAGEAMYQFLESTQLENPGRKAPGNYRWRDGVLLNPNGLRVAYSFRQPGKKVKHKIIPARDVVMFGEPQRCGHHRAIPPLAHAITNLIDVTEIRSDVKHAIKTSGLFGAIISGDTAAGGANPNAGAFSKLKGVKGPDGEEMKYEQVNEGSGGGIFRTGANAKVDVIKEARPHQNQRDLMDDLIRDAYAGMGYPPEVLWHLSSNTGPEVRSMMARCKQKVASDRRLLHKYIERISTYAIAKGIRAGKLPRPKAGLKWWKCETVAQADPTIDRSRDRDEWELVQKRGKSAQRFFGERGEHWKDQVHAWIELEEHVKKVTGGNMTASDFIKFNADPPPISINSNNS